MLAQLRTAGGASGSLMTLLMLTVLEKLLAQLPEGLAAATSGVTGAVARFTHLNQFEAERQRQVGGDGRNANCGPAALVMALRAVGRDIAGAVPGLNDGQAVALAQRAMVADPSRDGVTSSGQIAESEMGSFTSLGEVQRGAQASGATTQLIAPNAESVRQALLRGASVVLSGTFVGKSPLPWTGDRGHDNTTVPGGATGHFVTVTAYDSHSGYFLVHDPARRTPLAVSGPALEHFMRGNAGALAISR